MNAKEAIAKAKDLGVTLAVKDGMIHPTGATSPEARALLVQMIPMKQAIIEALTWPQNEALEAELAPLPLTDDLTCFVGAIVDDDVLEVLQQRAIAERWTLHTLPSDDKWYISGLTARREFGKLIVGAAPDAGHYHYVIKSGTPLYHKAADHKAYKSWLWTKMQEDTGDAAVLAELYTIINGAWVGCDVYIDGPNADAVIAAAGWLLNQYKDKGLPILNKPVQPQLLVADDKKKAKAY